MSDKRKYGIRWIKKAGYLTAMLIQNNHIMINQNHSRKEGGAKEFEENTGWCRPCPLTMRIFRQPVYHVQFQILEPGSLPISNCKSTKKVEYAILRQKASREYKLTEKNLHPILWSFHHNQHS